MVLDLIGRHQIGGLINTNIFIFRYNEEDILCIADWGKKLSFYNKNGSEVM